MPEKYCPHCEQLLSNFREFYVGVCYACRRHGLLTGRFPLPKLDRVITEVSSQDDQADKSAEDENSDPGE